MRKEDAIANASSCLNKASAGEPVFVLRAQDRCAPKIVRAWAAEARARGCTNEPKLAEAMSLALEMEAWQLIHSAKVPD